MHYSVREGHTLKLVASLGYSGVITLNNMSQCILWYTIIMIIVHSCIGFVWFEIYV